MYPKTKAVREVRRARAEAVQAQNAHLTPQERLARLDELKLTAKKERAKLAKKIAQLEAELLKPVKKAKK